MSVEETYNEIMHSLMVQNESSVIFSNSFIKGLYNVLKRTSKKNCTEVIGLPSNYCRGLEASILNKSDPRFKPWGQQTMGRKKLPLCNMLSPEHNAEFISKCF
jgi:hypothetical protein